MGTPTNTRRIYPVLPVVLAVLFVSPMWTKAQNSTYVSPFTITLDSSVDTSDYTGRTNTILQYSSPTQDDWSSYDYNGSKPYGPTLPQLYSAASLSANGTILAQQLTNYDRAAPVLGVPINSPSGGNLSVTAWQQQRVLAAAKSLIGTPYQHLHLPQFDPAALVTNGNFTWSAVSTSVTLQTTQALNNQSPPPVTPVPNPWATDYGKPQAGIDCTDFAAYTYNLGLGIQMHSGTQNQVTFLGSNSTTTPGGTPTSVIIGNNGNPITPSFLTGPHFGQTGINQANELNDVINALAPGDLLYMHGDNGSGDDVILHVVMWLGAYGTTSNGTTSAVNLVISSHDNTPAIFDNNGTAAIDSFGFPTSDIDSHLPPPGVQILPFTTDTWFYQNFSLAMHVIPEPPPGICAGIGIALVCSLAGLGRQRKGPKI
jgi:cell wall-associated NlpC family hydrolase